MTADLCFTEKAFAYIYYDKVKINCIAIFMYSSATNLSWLPDYEFFIVWCYKYLL